jgi:prevent-host-death family protein
MTIVRLKMQTIAAGTFKARCLAIMDEVQAKREPVTITKNGKPVAQLVPIVDEEKDPIFGFYAGKMTVPEDVEMITIPLEDWKRLK